LFASGNIVVGHDPESGEQRFFAGNTSPVCCLDVSKDGRLIAVAQEDKDPCVKVYEYATTRCLGTIPVKMNEIRSISISHNNAFLSVAGVDTYNRDLLTIWDLETMEAQKDKKVIICYFSLIKLFFLYVYFFIRKILPYFLISNNLIGKTRSKTNERVQHPHMQILSHRS